MPKFVIAVILSWIFSSHCLAADTNSKLSEIMLKITHVKQLLFRQQSQKTLLEQELSKTELAINKAAAEMFKTSGDLTKNQDEIRRLALKADLLSKKIQTQQTLLLKQIRLTYVCGLNKDKLQIFLRAHDSDKLNRLLMYNRFLTTHKHQLIKNLKTDLLNLNENKQRIVTCSHQLEKMNKTQAIRQEQLDSNKIKQVTLLNSLALQVKSQQDQLTELLKNKRNLETVVTRLQKKENYSPSYLTHFNGQFPWPTEGHIIEKFGSSIQQSELKQNGVLIQAPEGQKVYATAPGKVIFANWMPGYGLLLIIDHGKGYMTLYGNNGVLYKKTNDLVSKQELIARVGHTGGQRKSALYFALRHKGKPVDPATWCH
jgi:septal ring factor EnvC (AmiA/AmiB activator)